MKLDFVYRVVLFYIFYLLESSSSVLIKITSETPEIEQSLAAWNVINRIIPEKARYFKTAVNNNNSDPFDKFTIEKENGFVKITGSSGVAVTWGFNYYLKNYCNSHLGWQVKNINIPDELPDVNITVTASDVFRFYQNVCTTSYSMVWWSIKEWQEHIDWMALNGINIALAPHSQEAIWMEVYQTMNISKDELNDFFAGPAFLSWQRMGNIQSWGGPLSTDWHQHTMILQKFIINAMTQIGMIPALPAFSGFVPKQLKMMFPNAKMKSVESWNGFRSEFCCPLFLEPTDPLFNTIGNLFLTQMTEEYGKSHIYYSDPFNEIKPTSDDNNFIKNVGAAIFKSLTDVDDKSIWLIQNWMFVHDSLYWTPERVESYLTSVPLGRMLILDLQSEQWPQYEKYEMYYGQPFIWCMLHDFGGTLGMFGSSYNINTEVYKARKSINSTMIGIGITPEGINQNFVMYDLMLESGWRQDSLNLNDWAKNYTIRRYGKLHENITLSWNTLMKSVYDFRGLNKMRGKYVITTRPKLGIKPWSWYSSSDLLESWKLFLTGNDDLKDSGGYKHDLVDLTRQVLQYRADQIYILLVQAYNFKHYVNLNIYSEELLSLFDDLEELLSSHKSFLLSNWIELAKNIAYSDEDKKLFEYNARNQITLWGPNGEIFDYANKQWAGMVSDYYKPRWNIFLSALKESVKNNQKLDINKVKLDMFKNVEEPFTFSTKIYPIETTGDSIQIAEKLYGKWSYRNYPDLPKNVIPSSPTFYRQRREFHEIDDEDSDELQPSVLLIK